MDPANKTPTALPMQRVDLVATIVKRKKSADAIAAAAARAQARAARAAEVGPGDGEDDEEGDDEVYDIELSSDTPIDRGWYTETLDHSADAVNLERGATGINLLWNHNSSQPIGRVSDLKTKSGKLVGQAKFYSHANAQEKRSMVDEGMREVSVGYSVQSYEYTPGTAEAGDAYRATRWTPLEASLAPVPADNSVGISAQRGAGDTQFPVLIRSTNAAPAVSQEHRTMNETERAAAEAAAQAKAKLPTEIARLARKHGMADKTAEWLEAGHSIEKVREIIMEAMGTREDTVTNPSTNNGIDLPVKDQRSYSYARAIAMAADQADGRRGIKCLELEISETLERSMPNSYKRHGGIFIPTSLRGAGLSQAASGEIKPMSAATRELILQFQRSGVIDSATVNALKEVVFTEYGGELIEILRNIALVVAMGARVLTGLSSPIAFPRQLTDAVASWIAENPGSPGVAGSNPTTDLVTLNPHTLMASSAYSRQLLIQASIDVEAFVRSSIAAAHALAWDLAAIHGTGQNNQPLGIYNQPGVGTVDFTFSTGYGLTGNKISYGGCIQMEVLVANANALMGTLGYMTTPGIGGDAKNTLKFPGAAVAQGAPLWEGPLQEGGEMNGYKARATNQVAKTMGAAGAPTGGTFHGLIYGNWADVLIGQFGGAMEMIVDPYSLKKQGLVEVTSFQMADVAIRHPGSFAVSTGLNA
jgi:HK97 family phage major capsid protein/HK97 family phage prohead protease